MFLATLSVEGQKLQSSLEIMLGKLDYPSAVIVICLM